MDQTSVRRGLTKAAGDAMRLAHAPCRVLGDRELVLRRLAVSVNLMHQTFHEKPGRIGLGQLEAAGNDPSSQFWRRSNMELSEWGEAMRTVLMGARWKF